MGKQRLHTMKRERVSQLTPQTPYRILAIAASLSFALAGLPQSSDIETVVDEHTTIENMIITGEPEAAIARLDKNIVDLTRQFGRDNAQLLRPLVLKGDAFRKLGLWGAALESYDDARAVRRRHYGLHDLEQVDILYREAELLYEQEEYNLANDRHEYAFSIYTRNYGTNSQEILPGLFRLADWYMDTNNIFTARGLFEKALDIDSDVDATNTVGRIRALTGLAKSYRLERFRPSKFTLKSKKFTPRPYGTINHSEHYYAELNNFVKGEEALLQLVRLQTTQQKPTSIDLAKAKLELADWYLLFEKYRKAEVVYKDIWHTLEGTPQFSFVEDRMSIPQVLYKPLPSDPKPPERESKNPVIALEGRIEFHLTVTDRGKTREIKEVSAHPGSLLVRDTRQSATKSIYRPAFENGIATTTDDVHFVHTFPYYIGGKASRTPSPRKDASFRTAK